MKLSDIKVDSSRVEGGAWVSDIPNMGDLKLKVRGINNADYRRLQQKLLQAMPKADRRPGKMSVADQDQIQTRLLAETVLVDWAGLDDDTGQPIPYSRATAIELLANPDYSALRDAVSWAADIVGTERSADLEVDAGN